MSEGELLVAEDGKVESLVPYNFELDKIVKAGCKLCNSKHRQAVEEMFDLQKKKNYSQIKDWLKGEKSVDISVNAVKNHIIYHHMALDRNRSLCEFGEDLEVWERGHSNKILALKSRIAVLEREMMTMAIANDAVSFPDERRKNVEAIRKLSETILAHEDKLKEHEKDIEPLQILVSQLGVIISEEMEHVDSAATKRVLRRVLERLQESHGTMVVS